MALTMDPAFFIAWRKRMKLTQKALAIKLLVDESTVKKWERGARRFPSYIGLLMAAVEADLKPLGSNHMIEFKVGSEE